MTPLSGDQLVTGLLVRHINKGEWGLGKVLHVGDNRVLVYFSGYPGTLAEAVRTLSMTVPLLVRAEVQSDPWLDHLPPLFKDGKIQASVRVRVTEQQAIDLFVAGYVDFHSEEYLRRERTYKWEAHEKIASSLLSPNGRELVERSSAEELADVLRCAYQATNLLAPQEMMAVNDGLKSPAAAVSLGRSLLAFIDEPDARSFASLVDATGSLPAEKGRARVLTWPIVTVVPFLASPRRQMFLKPTMTRRMAEAFAFDLAYDAQPSWSIYRRLLTLSDLLLERLAPLGARDLIDVQSFMWIVAGSATPGSGARKAKKQVD